MSMFPHTVTVYITEEDPVTFEPASYITILRGVLLDATKAVNVRTSGLETADAVSLYIPFDVTAEDDTAVPKSYAPPKEFDAAVDKTSLWTIKPSDCFFVKGEVWEPDKDFQYINLNYDGVYRVTSVDEKDFGNLKHWEVGGR